MLNNVYQKRELWFHLLPKDFKVASEIFEGSVVFRKDWSGRQLEYKH